MDLNLAYVLFYFTIALVFVGGAIIYLADRMHRRDGTHGSKGL